MEHVLPNRSAQNAHPWRTIAVVAAGIATIELLGLVVVGVALLAKPVVHRARAEANAAAAPAKKTRKTPTRALLPRRSVTVTVLNGNGVAGAAADEASRVHTQGYKIRHVGNAARSGYGRSVIMYRPAFRGEALRLGQDLQIRLVTPLDGLRARDLRGAKVAVVVGG